MSHRNRLGLLCACLVLSSGCGPIPLIAIGIASGTGELGGGHPHHGGNDNGGLPPPPPSPPPPPPPQPPAAPSGLSATANGATRVDLQWTDGSTDHTGF